MSLVDLGATTQSTFSLTFADGSTPLQVRRVVVSEGLSELWSVTILATSSNHNLALDDLVDRGAACSLDVDAGARLWSGIVTEIEHAAAAADGVSQYRVVIRPELWRASLGQRYRVFQHASIPEIVLHVLEDWGFEQKKNVVLRHFEPSDTERFPKYEYRLQAEESDFRFVSRLLEEAGLTFYFDFANQTEGGGGETKGRELTKLVIDAEPQSASEVIALTYSEGADRAPSDKIATRASIERWLRPGSVKLVDHDFTRELGFRAQQTAQAEKLETSEAKYEVFQFVPGLQMRERAKPDGDRWFEDGQAQRVADFTASLRATATIVDFATTDHTACPGSVVKFASGSEMISPDRKLLVVESQLVGDANGARFTACRAVIADAPYRPRRVTPKPRIYGLQSALVVAPSPSSTESIHTDRYGRVRVQFHWDRQHQYGAALPSGEDRDIDALGSCWVRVLTPWAGSGYGVVAIPRVGHEVLVGFLDGDPDRPIIVGSLHDGPNATPFSRKDAALVTGLRSASSPDGGGYNELSFDDRKGEEKLAIQAERDLSTIVKADEARDVGRERTTIVAELDALHVRQKKWELVVGQQQVGITVLADKSIVVCVNGANGATVKLGGSEIAINAKGAIHYVAKGDLKFSSMATLSLDATQNVFINDPGRSPASPETGSHPTAQPAEEGGRIPEARLPSPTAPPFVPPGAMIADVDLASPPGEGAG